MCNLLRNWSQIMGESLKMWFFQGGSLFRNVMCSGFQTRAFFLSVCLYIKHCMVCGKVKLTYVSVRQLVNSLNAELNPICHLLALLGVHHFLHVSRIRVKSLTPRLLMSYIYMEHLFLMFLDHTQRRSTVGRTPLDE